MATCPKCDGLGTIPEDGEAVECVHCGGLGHVDPPESDWDQWADDVNRGIDAHRERMLD